MNEQINVEEAMKGFIATLLITFRDRLDNENPEFRHDQNRRQIYENDPLIKELTDKSVDGLFVLLKLYRAKFILRESKNPIPEPKRSQITIRDSYAKFEKDQPNIVLDTNSIDIVSDDNRPLFTIRLNCHNEIEISVGIHCKNAEVLLDDTFQIRPISLGRIALIRPPYDFVGKQALR